MQSSCVKVQETLRAWWASGLPLAGFLPEEPEEAAQEGPAPIDREEGNKKKAAAEIQVLDGMPALKLEEQKLQHHLQGCEVCRGEADAISELDRSLRAGFSLLSATHPGATPERIEEIVEELSHEAVDARFLRRLRRAVRFVLWAAFYGFTLLATSLLAVALYRALHDS